MNRQLSSSSSYRNPLFPMLVHSQQPDEPVLRTKTTSTVQSHWRPNQCLLMKSGNPYMSSLVDRHLPLDQNRRHMFPYDLPLCSTLDRQLSMPSLNDLSFVDCHTEEDSPLRIHVGNIPFLWTINDLCKQFQVFGPIRDPEIVSNERGSKGFGFITFLRHNDGLHAIRVKNGSIADGRKITVALASSRSTTRINFPHGHCYS